MYILYRQAEMWIVSVLVSVTVRRGFLCLQQRLSWSRFVSWGDLYLHSWRALTRKCPPVHLSVSIIYLSISSISLSSTHLSVYLYHLSVCPSVCLSVFGDYNFPWTLLLLVGIQTCSCPGEKPLGSQHSSSCPQPQCEAMTHLLLGIRASPPQLALIGWYQEAQI